ncbi:MAG: phosphoribosylanthranilate isomerase [Candidatus Eisenbacteria bacterium]|nr:phosphoribosylanthranilate isomerase [Candidatus Eisenbacteria bacterium]
MNERRTRIKICGLCRDVDARQAIDAGADYLGFVFAASPRQVQVSELQSWLPSVRRASRSVGLVAVFARTTRVDVESVLDALPFDLVQVHDDGVSTDALVAALRERGVRAVVATTAAAIGSSRLAPYAWLADTPTRPGGTEVAGGTGVVFDWSALPPPPRAYHLFLAGGLAADNVGRAIASVHPYAVDASSRLEAAPREKSREKMEAFVAAVRAADSNAIGQFGA